MKRGALVKRIRAAAAARDVAFVLIRQGSRHEFWELGGFRFAVPRHRDINEWTAEAIMRDLEPMLGGGLVATVKRYTVRARRIGSWWALDMDGSPGVHTQVRRIDQAEEMAREAIAGVLDIAPGSFEVVVAPEMPAPVRTIVEQATTARSQAAQAQDTAAQLTRDAARRLVQEGLTVRDAGALLGVSHQRVAQLVRQGR